MTENNQRKKSNKSIYILAFGVILALIASVAIIIGNRNYNQLVPVVKAAKEIEPFAVIQDTDLYVENTPLSDVKKGMYKNKEDLIGKATRALVVQNSPLMADAIATADGTKPLLSAKVTELKDKRLGAFTVPTDGIAALGGELSSGDLVHVIGALNLPTGPSKTAKEPVAKILAPYAKVIQVLGKGSQTAGVTLALSPQQAQDIQLALLNGRVSLMLLPYEPDMEAGYTETTTVESFMKKYINTTEKVTSENQDLNTEQTGTVKNQTMTIQIPDAN